MGNSWMTCAWVNTRVHACQPACVRNVAQECCFRQSRRQGRKRTAVHQHRHTSRGHGRSCWSTAGAAPLVIIHMPPHSHHTHAHISTHAQTKTNKRRQNMIIIIVISHQSTTVPNETHKQCHPCHESSPSTHSRSVRFFFFRMPFASTCQHCINMPALHQHASTASTCQHYPP